ncbi:MAG: endo-1,3-alpha-glucanase family glycosylhydrolase, partial [Victivallales bacterium]
MNKSLIAIALFSIGFISHAEPVKVFAHYMTCFTGSEEFCKREIALAHRYGLDGFALNCGEWKKLDEKGNIIDTNYVRNADLMFKAAKEDGRDFKLFFSPDFAGKMIKTLPDINLGDMVKRYYEHPNAFRYKGKYFLSGYAGMRLDYDSPARKLRNEGYEFYLVPTSSFKQYPMALSWEKILAQFPPEGQYDGLFRFTCDGTAQDLLKVNALLRRATMHLDKIYMAGLCPAYNSPNLRDYAGMKGYISMWEGLIRDGADMVEIVTWNDYNEDSNIMAYAVRYASGKRCFDRDESYLDVTRYFSNFYKNKNRPAVTQDKVYLTYRTHLKEQTKAWDEKDQKWDDARFNLNSHQIQMHDDVLDLVNVTAFLTAPGTIEIRQGSKVETFERPAGIVFAEAALLPGETPHVRLLRGKAALIDFTGRRMVVKNPTPVNSIQGRNSLLYRTWTNGAVAGKPAYSFDLKERSLKENNEEIILPVSSPGEKTYSFL